MVCTCEPYFDLNFSRLLGGDTEVSALRELLGFCKLVEVIFSSRKLFSRFVFVWEGVEKGEEEVVLAFLSADLHLHREALSNCIYLRVY